MLAEDAPDIDPAHDWIWDAWCRLGSGDRPYTVQGAAAPMGVTLIRSEPGSIPWTAVQMWIEKHGISDDDGVLLDMCIQRLDAEFKLIWVEKNKPNAQ